MTPLSILIPARNEVGAIGTLIAEIFAELDPSEVIVVDDGSCDGMDSALAELARAEPRLTLLRHAQSRGQSAALRTGMHRARHPWVATLDGDGQNPPGDIRNLIAARDEANDSGLGLVQGVRARRRDRWTKRVGSRIANAIRRAALKDDCPDSGCGLKLIRREAWLALPYFDHIHRFTPALMRADGWAVRLVEVGHRPRTSGCSHYTNLQRALVGLVDLAGVAWLIARRKNTLRER